MNRPPDQASVRFLRRILFVLIASTIATGGVATYAAVTAGQTNILPTIIAAK